MLCITINNICVVPGAPTDLQGVPGTDTVHLTWNEPSTTNGPILQYWVIYNSKVIVICWATHYDIVLQIIVLPLTSRLSYIAMNLTANTQYSFEVRIDYL